MNMNVIKNNTHISFKGSVQSQKQDRINSVIIYSNDTHGNIDNLYNMVGGIRSWQNEFKKGGTSPITLSAGDDIMYKNDLNPDIVKRRLDIYVKILNLMGLDAITIGNHELDSGEGALAHSLKKAKFKVVSSNLTIGKNSPFNKLHEDKQILKSTIIEKDGEKYGILGAFPVNEPISWFYAKNLSIGGIRPESDYSQNSYQDSNYPERMFKKTLEMINQELEKLKQQGINKIILISHLDYESDARIARETSGIDVIIGGHDHFIFDGLKSSGTDRPNLFKSKTGEPVILTQAGQGAEKFGILSLIFDKKGVIQLQENQDKKSEDSFVSSNSIIDSVNALQQIDTRKLIDGIIKKEISDMPTIGKFAEDVKPDFSRMADNSISLAMVDGLKELTGADIAISNSAKARSDIKKGNINKGNISFVVPLDDIVVTTKVSQKDMVDFLIQWLRIQEQKRKYDIMQPSGIKYKIRHIDDPKFTKGKRIKLEEVLFPEKQSDGTTVWKNIMNNPDTERKYTLVSEEFTLSGYYGDSIKNNCGFKHFVKAGKKFSISDGLAEYIKNHQDTHGIVDLRSQYHDNRIIISNLAQQKTGFTSKRFQAVG